MTKGQEAVSCFKDGFNCSQAVLSAYSKDLGMGTSSALKVSCGFGAGMGRMADTCGAVTGAYMVIGLKHGRSKLKDLDARDKTYSLVREFSRRFKARHGSVVCRKLLGFNVGTWAGMNKAKQKDIHHTVCPLFVKDACRILDEIL